MQDQMPPDLLSTIVGATRRAVASRAAAVSRSAMEVRALAVAPRGEDFRAALARTDRVNVIAECKRRSPSRGVLRRDYDPVCIARAYEQGGAAAVSVLTEPTFFDGALDHLEAIRAAVVLPLLRKDFVVEEYQVVEARAAGADAVLLIVAALDDRRLRGLLALAAALGLAALVEVHDAHELARALEGGATIVGVNNRNLRTLEVDVTTSHALIERMPREVVAVAESGLHDGHTIETLRAAGFGAFLIGERLVTEGNPGAALANLLAACASSRSSGAEPS